jgi:hypothetical protein
MFHLVSIAFLLAAPTPTEPAKGKTYKTPQEVFAAAMAFQRKKDFKAMVDCVAPEAQKDMAAGLALAALSIKEGNKDEIRKALKPLFDVLDRHGLTEKATKDIQTGDDPKTVEKSRAKLRKLIKAPAAFAVEYLSAQDRVGAGERPGETRVKLKGVKVKGDRASATMVIDFGGSKELEQPIEFVRIGGGWKLIPEPRQATQGK